jgi:ribosomal protein L37AE/L43A
MSSAPELGGTVHTCPGCGRAVTLRDAGVVLHAATMTPRIERAAELAIVADRATDEWLVSITDARPFPEEPTPQAEHRLKPKVCADSFRGAGCGKSFLPKSGAQKRCEDCDGITHARISTPSWPDRTCQRCPDTFAPKAGNQLYCRPCGRIVATEKAVARMAKDTAERRTTDPMAGRRSA